MSLRTSLRNLIRRSPVAALHERSAELHGSLAGQTRRTIVATPLAPAPGPAVSPEKAAFLDLMPQDVPVLRQYIAADAAWRAIADAADEAAGPFPGQGCTAEQHIAWRDRVEAERDDRG